MPHPTCETCGAKLSVLGSVVYAESYDAYLLGEDDSATVVADTFTIDSDARCARCGARVRYVSADLSSGGLARGRVLRQPPCHP